MFIREYKIYVSVDKGTDGAEGGSRGGQREARAATKRAHLFEVAPLSSAPKMGPGSSCSCISDPSGLCP